MTDNKVLEHLERDWRSRSFLLASQLYKDQEESLSETCAFLRKRAEEKERYVELQREILSLP